jgi:hypothetical protein
MTALILSLALTSLGDGEKPAGTDAEPNTGEVRASVERSLAFLRKEGTAWMSRGCASCHHIPMMAWSHHEAEKHGFTINRAAVDEAEGWASGQYLGHPEFAPTQQDRSFATKGPGQGGVFLAIGVGASEKKTEKQADVLHKLSGHFARMQEVDGSWAIKKSDPPIVDGDDVATLLILLALDAPKDSEVGKKAMAWLEKAPVRDETQPLALRAIVAARYGSIDEARKIVPRLRESQRDDGGWGQTKERSSDALATGQALCALVAAGEPPDAPSIRRARKFLVASQRGDGSWLVRPRLVNRHDEIISYYGTGWATIGLMRSSPR